MIKAIPTHCLASARGNTDTSVYIRCYGAKLQSQVLWNGKRNVLKHWNLLPKEMNLSSSQLCTEQWGIWAADTAQHPELHKQGRKPSEQRNMEWNKREKDFLGELLQALTFQELAELRLLLQPGLEVEELPVAAVHGVISHLLEAACGLALQGCLILRRKAKAQSLHILKQSWSLLAPQSPGPTHVPPSNSSHQPFPEDEGTHHDRTKAGYKRFDQPHRALQESLCHYQTATVPGIPPDKIYCRDTHRASPQLQTPAQEVAGIWEEG